MTGDHTQKTADLTRSHRVALGDAPLKTGVEERMSSDEAIVDRVLDRLQEEFGDLNSDKNISAEREKSRALVKRLKAREDVDPADVRMQLRKGKDIIEHLRSRCIKVFEQLGHDDPRFDLPIPDHVWSDVKKQSRLPDKARSTIGAICAYYKASIEVYATPTNSNARKLHDGIETFLPILKSVSGDKALIDHLSITAKKAHRKRTQLGKQLESTMQFLSEIYEYSDPPAPDFRAEILFCLDMCLQHYTHRPITRGVAKADDLGWIDQVCKLIGSNVDRGLQDKMQSYIGEFNGLKKQQSSR